MKKVTLTAVPLWLLWAILAVPTATALPINARPGAADVVLAEPWMGALPDPEGAPDSDLADYRRPLFVPEQVDGAVIQLDWHLVMPLQPDRTWAKEPRTNREADEDLRSPQPAAEYAGLSDIIRPYINIAVSSPDLAAEGAVRGSMAAGNGASADDESSRDHGADEFWYLILEAMINRLLQPIPESEDMIAFSVLGLGRFVAQWREDTKELFIIELISGSLWSFKRSASWLQDTRDPAAIPLDDASPRHNHASAVTNSVLNTIIAWVMTKLAAIIGWLREWMIYIYFIPVPIMLIVVLAAFTASGRRRFSYHPRD